MAMLCISGGIRTGCNECRPPTDEETGSETIVSIIDFYYDLREEKEHEEF